MVPRSRTWAWSYEMCAVWNAFRGYEGSMKATCIVCTNPRDFFISMYVYLCCEKTICGPWAHIISNNLPFWFSTESFTPVFGWKMVWLQMAVVLLLSGILNLFNKTITPLLWWITKCDSQWNEFEWWLKWSGIGQFTPFEVLVSFLYSSVGPDE